MAIDISFPDEIERVRHQVRKFCDEVVRPSEALIEANEGDRNESFFALYPNIAQKAGVRTFLSLTFCQMTSISVSAL